MANVKLTGTETNSDGGTTYRYSGPNGTFWVRYCGFHKGWMAFKGRGACKTKDKRYKVRRTQEDAIKVGAASRAL
jgi:hypothetical protein